MNTAEEIKTSLGTTFFLEENIIYTKLTKQTKIEIEDIQEAIDAVLRLAKEQPFGYMFDALDSFPQISNQAIKYATNHKEFNNQLTGVSILINTPVVKIFADFYLALSPNKSRSKTFSKKIEAIEYLNSLNNNN